MAGAADRLGCADCAVRDRAVCAVLSMQERDELAAIGQQRTLRAGETLFEAGDESIACLTVIEGMLKLSRIDAEGTERLVGLVSASDFLGRLFATEVDVSASALTDCQLCVFPRMGFERIMSDRPLLTQQILARTMASLSASRDLVELIGRRSARGKLVGFLLMLAEGQCEGSVAENMVIDLPLGRADMAGLLGITVETLSRQFTALENDGWIERRGTGAVVIKSRDHA